jgi:hypothetical protein
VDEVVKAVVGPLAWKARLATPRPFGPGIEVRQKFLTPYA